jgi:hypothetical protein
VSEERRRKGLTALSRSEVEEFRERAKPKEEKISK